MYLFFHKIEHTNAAFFMEALGTDIHINISVYNYSLHMKTA